MISIQEIGETGRDGNRPLLPRLVGGTFQYAGYVALACDNLCNTRSSRDRRRHRRHVRRSKKKSNNDRRLAEELVGFQINLDILTCRRWRLMLHSFRAGGAIGAIARGGALWSSAQPRD
jgi:hypothetical protein